MEIPNLWEKRGSRFRYPSPSSVMIGLAHTDRSFQAENVCVGQKRNQSRSDTADSRYNLLDGTVPTGQFDPQLCQMAQCTVFLL